VGGWGDVSFPGGLAEGGSIGNIDIVIDKLLYVTKPGETAARTGICRAQPNGSATEMEIAAKAPREASEWSRSWMGWVLMSTDETHGAPKTLFSQREKAGEANPRMPEGCGNKKVLGAVAGWWRVF